MKKVNNLKVVGECTGTKDIRHKDCGGAIMVDGYIKHRLPLGFGFRGTKFVVDKAEYSGFSGMCLKCGTDGVFLAADKKPKLITITPRSLNKRIQTKQKGE